MLFSSTYDWSKTLWYSLSEKNIVNITTTVMKNISIFTGTANAMMWSLTGSQGDQWLMGKVGIKSTVPLSVVIEGIRGTGIRGDIAVDDISYQKDNYCARKSK